MQTKLLCLLSSFLFLLLIGTLVAVTSDENLELNQNNALKQNQAIKKNCRKIVRSYIEENITYICRLEKSKTRIVCTNKTKSYWLAKEYQSLDDLIDEKAFSGFKKLTSLVEVINQKKYNNDFEYGIQGRLLKQYNKVFQLHWSKWDQHQRPLEGIMHVHGKCSHLKVRQSYDDNQYRVTRQQTKGKEIFNQGCELDRDLTIQYEYDDQNNLKSIAYFRDKNANNLSHAINRKIISYTKVCK